MGYNSSILTYGYELDKRIHGFDQLQRLYVRLKALADTRILSSEG